MTADLKNSLAKHFPLEPANILMAGFYGVISGIGLYNVNQSLIKLFFAHNHAPQNSFGCLCPQSIKKNRNFHVAAQNVSNILITPVVEEYLFRGELFDFQKQRKTASQNTALEKTKDILCNAALFSAFHFDPRIPMKQTIKMMPSYLIAGIALCSLAESTGNLWAPTFAHIQANALGVRYLRKLN